MALHSTISDCLDKYRKVIRLREIDSKEDPDGEPYRSRYAARDLLNDIKNSLDEVLSPTNEEHRDVLNAISAHIEYYLGLIAAETEEFSNAEERLQKSLKLSEDREITQTHILTCLLSYNELGVLWSLRGDNKQAADYLKRSAQLSQKYRNDVELPPHSPQDLFRVLLSQELDHDIDNWKLFEDALTHCVYYLAQAFTQVEEAAKAAVCYELTLRRQLDCQEFDGIEWATNAATLSQYFISEKNFPAARHLLACATKVLEDHSFQKTAESAAENEDDTAEDILRRRKADIAHCWVKYGNLLLTVSWTHLLNLNEESSEAVSEKGEGELERVKEVDVGFNVSGLGGRDPHKMFESLGADDIEKQVTADKVFDYSQARLVFLNAQKWLNAAKEYYTFEEHASDHIQLSQEMSQLYKILAQFESNDERRCKMHKRRIDLLEAILDGVNPKYYCDFCRQIYFEVGEIYSEMMDIKLSIISESSRAMTTHATLKVHSLASKAIVAFNKFVDSFKLNGELPEEIAEDFVRPVLLAHVFLGRLHSKLNASDAKTNIDYLNQSLKNYKYVVDYCNAHPDAEKTIKHELEVTKEMVNLLPIKIEKIVSEEFC